MLITVVPEIHTQAELSNLLHRIGFYFGHRELDRVTIGIVPSSTAPTLEDCILPSGFDPVAAERLSTISHKVELVADSAAYEARLLESDVVLLWNRDRLASGRWHDILDRLTPRTDVVGVDLRRDRMEGSLYVQVEFANNPRAHDFEVASRRKFDDLHSRLAGVERAYLLATGPSIDSFAKHDFSDGLVVACNTTVLDDELMDHADPDIITFADPIFHFGCSTYAEAFRRELRRQAETHDFAVVIPIKYYDLFTSLCPELEPHTIGIPFGPNQINLRLDIEFAVRSIANIATLLMLPIACTFARDIAFLGFDGRSQAESYFWRHSRRTQLHELLPVIRTVHPSFFDTDYDDYYNRHAADMERYLTLGETLGHSFVSLEESFVPALRRRSVEFDEAAFAASLGPGASYRLVSLNPDLEDEFGHFRLYDSVVRKAAAEDGGDVVSIANSGAVSDEPWILPALADNSWAVRRVSPEVHVERFRRQFRNVYETVAQQAEEIPTAIYLYVGSERHLIEIADVVARSNERVPILMNLFYSHRDLFEVEQGLAGPAVGMGLSLTRSFRDDLGIHVFADSEGLQRLVHRYFGERLPLWPMFSVSDISPALSDLSGGESEPKGRQSLPVTLYAPGNVQFAKGYDLLSELAERLAKHSDHHQVMMVGRSYVRSGTNPKLQRHADRLQQHAKVLDGLLSDSEYIEAFRVADVILIPYRLSHFSTRTSAVISDAVVLGKPVVATRGTWIGDIVERYDMGATFEDGDVDDFERGVWKVIAHIDYYKAQASQASSSWAAEHQPRMLVDTMIDAVESRSSLSPRMDIADHVENMRDTYVRLLEYSTDSPKGKAEGQSTSHTTNANVEDLQNALADARQQLRNVKGSAAFRVATKAVAFLKRLGPVYRLIRALVRKLVGA